MSKTIKATSVIVGKEYNIFIDDNNELSIMEYNSELTITKNTGIFAFAGKQSISFLCNCTEDEFDLFVGSLQRIRKLRKNEA